MIVIGIDPGTQRAGYAVIETGGATLEIHDLGFWNLLGSSRDRPSLGIRLESLSDHVRGLFKQWNPDFIGLEKAVTFKSVTSAHTLSEARGVVRLAAYELLERADDRLVELSPTSIKKEAAGFGSASKDSVRRGLSLRFRNFEAKLGETKLSPDAFDALAIAWTTWVLKGRYRRPELKELGAR